MTEFNTYDSPNYVPTQEDWTEYEAFLDSLEAENDHEQNFHTYEAVA